MDFITDEKGLEGKTIKKAILEYEGPLVMVFTDGTMCGVEIERGYDEMLDVNFIERMEQVTIETQHKLGILSETEYKAVLKRRGENHRKAVERG